MVEKIILSALEKKTTARPPVWVMRQAGRYLPEYREVRAKAGSFLDLCYSPELATEVTLQPLRRFALDAAILFSDILVIPDALGRKVAFLQGEGPQLEPLQPADITKLDTTQVVTKLAPVYEAVSRIRTALPAEKTLLGFCGGPWTVACYMLEGHGSKTFAAAKRWLYAEPEMFTALIDILVEASVQHLAAQIEAGADAVQLFESWAGMVPHNAFENTVYQPLVRIATQLKARHPQAKVIVFARGAHPQHLLRLAQSGAFDGMGLDETQDFAWCATHLAPLVTLQGALDNTLLLTSPETVRGAVEKMYGGLHGKAAIIANLGHGILPETPIENMAAYVEATHKVWQKT